MKRIDQYAITKLHIPSLRLMENAGKAVVNEILNRIKNISEKSVLIFCGKGNNGGDGLVVARRLIAVGASVKIVLIENRNKFSKDALNNYQILQSIKSNKYEILSLNGFLKRRKKNSDIIIDSMLGTSFKGKLGSNYRKAIDFCHKQNSLKIAIDIPTGLNGETGEVAADAFGADCTITMSQPKIGFYCKRAKEFTGEIIVAKIGIPKKAVRSITASQHEIVLYEMSDVRKNFPRRSSNSHKHSVGKIFILAGSRGMMGASLLCSKSAMRSGAGQVILGIPDSEYSIVAKRTVEVMPLGLDSTKKGSISIDAKEKIFNRLVWANVLLIGCGMSQHKKTQQLIREIIKSCEKPIVVDADGLNAIVGHLELLKISKSKNIVLTPHMGEFSRLIGIPSKEIEENKFILASQFAKKYKVTLVLKGRHTIIADKSGHVFVNVTGNEGMSTAGSGDVLAGIIASFIGQGNSTIDAARNAVFIHGLSGDIAAKEVGMMSLIATDLISFLPSAIKRIVER